jgi:hypothetical protein
MADLPDHAVTQLRCQRRHAGIDTANSALPSASVLQIRRFDPLLAELGANRPELRPDLAISQLVGLASRGVRSPRSGAHTEV